MQKAEGGGKIRTFLSGSQNSWLLRWLMTGQRITARQAVQIAGIYRLAARVADLRDAGVRVESSMRVEDGVRYAVYWLGPSEILRLRERKAEVGGNKG